jgi:hypothetical protein
VLRASGICPDLAQVELSVFMAVQQELTKALREARLASAAKLYATLDLSDARALRLDALRAELLPIIVANSDAAALFNLNVQAGETPKLWLDLVSSVVMEPDPRTYRLMQDHANRRETLFESTNINEMAAHIVKYLAHRIVAHEKMARGLSPMSEQFQKAYSVVDLVYVWLTGAAVGVLGLMIAAMLLGKLSF